jgi:hypothetical protein
MKRGVILGAAALSMTGATGAHLLTAPYQGAPAEPPVISNAKPVQKASLEVRQTPVPLQMKPRPPVNLPTERESKPLSLHGRDDAVG